MPQTKTITVYSFDELSPSAQDRAIEKLYDLNVDDEWWDYIYDDAKECGVYLSSFDIDHKTISGSLRLTVRESARAITESWQEGCDLYETAKSFLDEFNTLESQWHTDNAEEDFISSEIYEDLEDEYRRAILECFLVVLREEYDYQTSREQIEEAIRANEYTFDESGDLV